MYMHIIIILIYVHYTLDYIIYIACHIKINIINYLHDIHGYMCVVSNSQAQMSILLHLYSIILMYAIEFDIIVYIFFQISEATDVQSLRHLCLSAADITIEAGYTLPLTSLQLDDREDLTKTLMLHHVILCRKAVLDQLMTGLSYLGVLEAIQRHPVVFEPYSVQKGCS